MMREQAMTWTEFRDAWPGYNPRYLAWCLATGRTPLAFRLVGAARMEFSRFIEDHKAQGAPGIAENGGIVDQDAFTEYLWEVADEMRRGL